MSMIEAGSKRPGNRPLLGYVVLVLLLVVAIGLLAGVGWLLAGYQSELRSELQRASDLRLSARQILLATSGAAAGDETGAQNLSDAAAAFRRQLDVQMAASAPFGSSQLGMQRRQALAQVEAAWAALEPRLKQLLAQRDLLGGRATAQGGLERSAAELQAALETLAGRMETLEAPADDIELLRQEVERLQPLVGRATAVLSGSGDTGEPSLDALLDDTRRLLEALREGDRELRVRPLASPAAADPLSRADAALEQLRRQLLFIQANSAEFATLRGTLSSMEPLNRQLLQAVDAAAGPANNAGPALQMGPGLVLSPQMILALAALALALLAGLVTLQLWESRRRTRESERKQRAILRLLDEISSLAEGDLTVTASVTEDETGSIADAINFSVEALRDLVLTLREASERVASATRSTRSIAEGLAKASETQAVQIASATRAVDDMANSMGEMSTNAASSGEVAAKSVAMAKQGGQRVRRTIEGMDAIRQHIQATSKRIKRLGESSQEIGAIVELINDIAEQTNILALNAAIQASSAGEAGRGFAVVADEVQRLAERAGNATKRIETLVKTIQADTSEAILSMEKSTAEVVNGAELAENAGESLEEIETVSTRLAELITDISEAAGRQAEVAATVLSTTTNIKEITSQATEGAARTAASIGELSALADSLRRSVAGFRLPEEARRAGA